MSDYDAVVIGAGQAGLVSSYHLKKHGISHIVLERGTPANTWLTQRWDTFMLNTMSRFTSLPGMALNDQNPDGFENVTTLSEHFNNFISANGLPVRTGAGVESLTRSTDTGKFLVTVSGDDEPISCSAVICASGSQNSPKTPILNNHLPENVISLHTAEYRNPESLPDGAVLVVGSAQSGVQIAEDLLDAGRTVYLSTSRAGRAPRRFAGQDTTHWFAVSGFLGHRPADLEDPNEMKMVQPQVSGTRGGHTVSLQGLARRGVTLLGRLEMVEDGIAQFRDNLRENIEFGDKVSTMLKTRLTAGLTAAGMDLPPSEPDPEDEVDPSAYDMESPSEIDLSAAGIKTVIWATGFRGDYSYLNVDGALQNDGQPSHTDGVSDIGGLYFIGMPWTRTRGSGIVYGVNDDAEAITGHLANHIRT